MSNGDSKASARPACSRRRCPYVTKLRGLCAKHYYQDLRERVARGEFIPGNVDPARTRAHIALLREAGLGFRTIGELAGVHPDQVAKVARRRPGERQSIRAQTEAAITAVPVPAAVHRITVDGHRVNAIGSARRLQALVAIGYSQRELAPRIGVLETNLTKVVVGRQTIITAGFARRIEAVFDALQLIPRDDSRAIRRAARRGWAPPLAWDEDTIDDPDARPAPWHLRPSRVLPPDWAEMVADRRELGRPDERIAAELGIEVESLYRRFDRAGLPRDYGRFGRVA